MSANSRSENVINSLVNRIIDLEADIRHENADTSRFLPVTQQQTTDFVQQLENESTKRITASHCRLLVEWLKTRGEIRPPEDIEPMQLDSYLAEFFLSVRKHDDSKPLNDPDRQYEPNTLIAMQSSFHRYLVGKGYKFNLKQDDLFRHSRTVLSAKMKELKQLGKGNRPNAAEPFTQDELRTLMELQLIGTSKYTK